MSYNIDLSGKVAVITGAGKGIGAAIAAVLCEAGAQVVINDILEIEQVSNMLDDISKKGNPPLYLKYDISTEDEAKLLIGDTVKKHGRVDILVNNAGVVADWDKSWSVHVKGAFYCSEAAKTYLSDSKGRIIIITSASVFTGGTGIPQYVASKGGSFALTRFLAKNYAPLGIRVNGIAPAVIMSAMLMTRYKSEEELIEHYAPRMPIGRIGYPLDIAKVALFLGSDLSDMLCGEIIVADGGRMHIG